MKTEMVKSGPVEIYVEYNYRHSDEGARKETILFVHGYPDYSGSWSYQVDEFKDDYNVACMDLRGVHNSTAPPSRSDYHIDNVIPDINAVINFIAGPSGRVHLVGHDWGAILSWSYVSRRTYRERVISYTAISCPHPGIAYEKLKEELGHFDVSLLGKKLQQFLKSYYIFMFQLPVVPEMLWQAIPEVLWRKAYTDGGLEPTDEIFELGRKEILSIVLNPINLYREFLQGKKQPVPQNLDIPVNLLIPLYDLAIEPETYAGTSDYVKDLEVHNLAANHWVHREKPELVNRILRKFISSHAAVKAAT